MKDHKVVYTNVFFTLLFLVGFVLPQESIFKILQLSSLFALSGALTNQLAVYMLFEKIPFVIGSGVIPKRFEGFKSSIRDIILNNFFRQENFQNFQSEAINSNWKQTLLSKIDLTKLFDSIVIEISASEEASLLNMFGGAALLEKFREPFQRSAKQRIVGLLDKVDITKIFAKGDDYQIFLQKVTRMLDQELKYLTPERVKQIVSEIIKLHLSWLVVWGGLFGFILGLISSFFFHL